MSIVCHYFKLLLSAKSWRICIMTGLASDFGSQPFLGYL